MDNSDNVGFVPDFQAAWQNAWPRLRNEVDALVLMAFRVLVSHLDQQGFFRQRCLSILEVKNQAESPPELWTLVRTNDPRHVPKFAKLVYAQLDSRSLVEAANLAFAIDIDWGFGRKLSHSLDKGKRTDLQNVARAVNGANSLLMGLAGERPMILVRPSKRYWSNRKGAVSKFPLVSQGTATYFEHLLPTTTKLKRVPYSAIGGGSTEKLVVALWPVKAPSIKSDAIKMGTAAYGCVQFNFKCWGDLPKPDKEQQECFANQIADYIYNEDDALGTVNIVAAPELTLAPESLSSIVTALKTRKNAAWIVFPGSYHIGMKEGIINLAPICVGGVLRRADLAGGQLEAPAAAVKCNPVVFPKDRDSLNFIEDIDGRESLTHVLDTSVGRIAVMICRDFLDGGLRDEIVSMGVDHLFVLSMSPDRGPKFKDAMDSASNSQTGCFFVNAFSENIDRQATHRAPLKGNHVNWVVPAPGKGHCPFVLEPE